MSQLKTNNITHLSNTGDPNIVLGDSGDVQVQSLNSGPLAGFRNQIINGNMSIWQRGTSGSTASNGFLSADRWKRQSGGASTNTTLSKIDSPYPGFANALRITSTDNTNTRLRYAVELDEVGKAGRFIGTWILSFYASSTPSDTNLAFADGSNRVNPQNWTMGTLQSLGNDRYSITATAATPAATNDCIVLSITPPGTDWNITGIQLEPGPVATPFEHRPIGTELALCQRYYQKLNEVTGIGPVGLTQAQNTTRMVCFLPTKCTMRAAPSVGLPSTADFQLQVNDSDFGAMDFAIDQSCPSGVFVLVQPDSGNANRFTTGGSGRLFTVNANAGSFTADAEL